ncbi:MAG: hypothetical protein GF364_16770 [Candidatus Lokiarchaeota archaeon]|nr:hypothetical protein [Candidatus Lokiarchaeota archaeon]
MFRSKEKRIAQAKEKIGKKVNQLKDIKKKNKQEEILVDIIKIANKFDHEDRLEILQTIELELAEVSRFWRGRALNEDKRLETIMQKIGKIQDLGEEIIDRNLDLKMELDDLIEQAEIIGTNILIYQSEKSSINILKRRIGPVILEGVADPVTAVTKIRREQTKDSYKYEQKTDRLKEQIRGFRKDRRVEYRKKVEDKKKIAAMRKGLDSEKEEIDIKRKEREKIRELFIDDNEKI